MKLIPYDVTKLNVNGYKMSDNYRLLDEFRNSDLTCAEVKDFTHRDAPVCAGSINQSIKRYKIGNVHAICRKGRVFLIKTTND